MFNIAPFSSEDIWVGQLAEALALRCGSDPATASLIGKAAALHDVGKSRVPFHILSKPDDLTLDEFRIIKTHTFWGGNVLLRLQGDFGVMARNVCIWHHERYDKSGYWGKSTDELPAYVHMVALCDVYVALTSPNRPYKRAWSHNQALGHVESKSGKQFCPKLAKTFLALMVDNPALQEFTFGEVA